MSKKTVKFNNSGINNLPNNKPAVYKIQTEGGKTNYVGIAKRGRVTERLQEHLNNSTIPGAKVQIQQTSSIQETQNIEASTISKLEPKYNKAGK